MSGHSKWANIKHQKEASDAKRGQLFTKFTREIIVAVRQGGSDPDANYRLRLAIQKARDSNMPVENIERSIKKGSGELEGAALVEMVLEGYGPSGAAVLVQALSDNRNRTVQDIRNVFSRHGGSLGENGSVAWLFDSKGMITVEGDNLDSEELTLKAIDAGAEDVSVEKGSVEIYTKPHDLEKVKTALEQKKVPLQSVEISMQPKTMVQLDEKAAMQAMKLLEKLEEIEEVQSVASNADFDPSLVEKYQLQQV